METTTKDFVNTEIDYALKQIMGKIDSTEHWVLAGDTSAAEKERIKHHMAHMKDTIECLMRHIKENVETGVLLPFRTMSWGEDNTTAHDMYVAPEVDTAPAAVGASTPRPEEDAAALWGAPPAFPYHIPRVLPMATHCDE